VNGPDPATVHFPSSAKNQISKAGAPMNTSRPEPARQGPRAMNCLAEFIRDESGATAAEYAFLLILIIGAASVALATVGNNTRSIITTGAGKI
jgi:Flp pilus assembly pilin Flp